MQRPHLPTAPRIQRHPHRHFGYRLVDERLPFIHHFVDNHIKSYFSKIEADTSTHSRHLLNIARHIEQALIEEWSLQPDTLCKPECVLREPMQRLAALLTSELSQEHFEVLQALLDAEIDTMHAAFLLGLLCELP